MKEMAKVVPDAASYAPVTILVDERADGVHLSYDFMASLLAPYGHDAALQVARDLDAKIEDLLRGPRSDIYRSDWISLENASPHPLKSPMLRRKAGDDGGVQRTPSARQTPKRSTAKYQKLNKDLLP
jgi:hypothetical protein